MGKREVFNEFLSLIETHRPDLLDEANRQQNMSLPSFGDWLQTNFPEYSWSTRPCMNLADDMRDYFEKYPVSGDS
jgi:hypothetical protein